MNKSIINLIAVLLFGTSYSYGQNYQGVEDVLAFAAQKQYLIQNLDLSKKSEQLNSKSLLEWSPLGINYQAGQINYPGFDHYLGINQDISPLFRFKERTIKKDLIEDNIALLDTKQKLVLRELKFDLQLAFNELYYAYSMQVLQDSIANFYQKLTPKMQTLFDAGELDAVDFVLFSNEKNNMQQQQKELEQQFKNAVLQIKQIALLDDSASLTPLPLQQIAAIATDFNAEGSLLFATYENNKAILDTEIKLATTKSKQLNYQIGYFAQSLERVFIYQGFNIGIQIPLDRRSSKTKIQQLALEKQQLDNEKEFQIIQFERQINTLKNKLDFLKNSINNYQQQTLPLHQEIVEKATKQYLLGGMDFVKFSLINKQLLEKQNTYLEWVKSYNENQLQLIYLTNPQ